MHILIANNIYPPIAAGGAELIVAYLAEELAARDNRVTVVSTCGPEMEPYPVEHRNGVEVIRFFPRNLYWNFSRQGIGGARKALWHLRDAWNRDAHRRMAQIMADARPQLLHTHLVDGFSASIWHAARQRGMKVVHTAHDYHLLCPRAFMLTRDWKLCTNPSVACRTFRRFHLATTRHLDLFTSPSRFLLDLHRQSGLCTQAAVVRNGIPLPNIAREPRTRAATHFVFLARLTTEKGVQVVLDAMAQIPPDAPITLSIGGKGPLEDRVRAAAASDPRITYLGYVTGDAKQDLLRRADHLLLPSMWYENAPVVILEAAAYNLGLIASDIGGIPEFVQPGRTGWLVPPGDAAALATAMQTAAQDTGFRAALPQHTAPLIAASSVAAMADAFTTQYEALLTPARVAA